MTAQAERPDLEALKRFAEKHLHHSDRMGWTTGQLALVIAYALSLEQALRQAQDERAALRATLAQYGAHSLECEAATLAAAIGPDPRTAPCICALAAVLQEGGA